MQRLSLWLITTIAVLALSGAAFTNKPASPAVASAMTTHPVSTNYYYWYSAFDESYNDYEDLSYETWEMEMWYGVLVNTDQVGGTLVEKGYLQNNPNMTPNILLYAHF